MTAPAESSRARWHARACHSNAVSSQQRWGWSGNAARSHAMGSWLWVHLECRCIMRCYGREPSAPCESLVPQAAGEAALFLPVPSGSHAVPRRMGGGLSPPWPSSAGREGHGRDMGSPPAGQLKAEPGAASQGHRDGHAGASTWSQRDLGNIFLFPVKGSFEKRKGKQ